MIELSKDKIIERFRSYVALDTAFLMINQKLRPVRQSS